METKSPSNTTNYAVVNPPGTPETGSYTPIIIGPGGGGVNHGGKPRISGDSTTMTIQVWAGDPTYGGTANCEIQFYGMNEDASGNISLIDDVTQIPEHNGIHGNRKQAIQIVGQTKTNVTILLEPNSTEVEIMALVRPVIGGPTGNVGVYFFTII